MDHSREVHAQLGDSVIFEDHVDATIATPIHRILQESAADAAARSRAGSGSRPDDELREACVAILVAAVAIEAATHWAAHRIDPDLLIQVQDDELQRKWQTVAERVSSTRLELGAGLGQAVAELVADRNRIAHFPSRGEELFSPPAHAAGGGSATRAYFSAERAAIAVATARQAVALLGE